MENDQRVEASTAPCAYMHEVRGARLLCGLPESDDVHSHKYGHAFVEQAADASTREGEALCARCDEPESSLNHAESFRYGDDPEGHAFVAVPVEAPAQSDEHEWDGVATVDLIEALYDEAADNGRTRVALSARDELRKRLTGSRPVDQGALSALNRICVAVGADPNTDPIEYVRGLINERDFLLERINGAQGGTSDE